MNATYNLRTAALVLLIFVTFASTQRLMSQPVQPNSSGDVNQTAKGWIRELDATTGRYVNTIHLKIHPADEPRPAMKYRFIPGSFDLQDGNAAIFYLNAISFSERSRARDYLAQFQRNSVNKAAVLGIAIDQVPPYNWLQMHPDALPLTEVKEYLENASFQQRLMEEARNRKGFSFDRNIKLVDRPYEYLLPEIQSMRELSRTQSLRCRVAVAEGRIDDASALLGQHYALAYHLGNDEFVICCKIGIGIGDTANDDALYVLQHERTPNLYWAFAALPDPLISMELALDTERKLFLQHFKFLAAADELPHSSGYWRDFVDQNADELVLFFQSIGWRIPGDDWSRARLATYIASAYPGAKRYLLERNEFTDETIEQLTTIQTVLLAIKQLGIELRDESVKWSFTPNPQMAIDDAHTDSHRRIDELSAKAGWIGEFAKVYLGSTSPNEAIKRRQHCQSRIEILKTVEGIRMYAARNNRRLPESLNGLPVPTPIDPDTGKPPQYELKGGTAILTRSEAEDEFRYVISIAQ